MNNPSELCTSHDMTKSNEIIDMFSFFDSWEERYRYIIECGKNISSNPISLRSEGNQIQGCQSQVWVHYKYSDYIFEFYVDSDALIVKGLLAIVMAAYNHKTKQAILDFDIDAYFSKLGLMQHLSMTRGNGLRAMVLHMKQLALHHNDN
jgi:cysteine desulfuration protein SufE